MKIDGGAAFARTHSVEECGGRYSYHDAQVGMTLRDYFAAAALTGLLSNGSPSTRAEYAENAYSFADAMLEAREEEDEQ